MNEKEIECTINGKVQAVGFRQFTKKKADELEVFGFVHNIKDGSVEVVAQGQEDDLRALIVELNKGPYFSRVDDVQVVWHDRLQDAFTEFTIEE